MSTCKECIYWNKHKHIKNYGTCEIPVPSWVDLEEVDNITFMLYNNCPTFKEEQEPDCYKLQRKLDICQSSHQILKTVVDNL